MFIISDKKYILKNLLIMSINTRISYQLLTINNKSNKNYIWNSLKRGVDTNRKFNNYLELLIYLADLIYQYIRNNIDFLKIISKLNIYVLLEKNYLNIVKNYLEEPFKEPIVVYFRSMTSILYLVN